MATATKLVINKTGDKANITQDYAKIVGITGISGRFVVADTNATGSWNTLLANATGAAYAATSIAGISGCSFWAKADAITPVADGTAITSWVDSSGNSRTLTGTGTYKTNILNGLPVVRFSTAQSMVTAYTQAAPCTVFTVSRYQNVTGTTRKRVVTASGNNWLLGHHAEKSKCFFFGTAWAYNPNSDYRQKSTNINVKFKTIGGVLPSPLAADTIYRILDVDVNTYKVCIQGGTGPQLIGATGIAGYTGPPPIDITAIGTGTNYPFFLSSTCSVDYADTITCASHGLSNNQALILQTSGTLPDALTPNRVYLAANVAANTLNLIAALGFPIENIRGTGTGTHELFGDKGTCTATVATSRINATNHGLAANTKILFKSTQTLPSPLVYGTPYYVVNPTTNDFQVSASSGGGAITLTTSESGTMNFFNSRGTFTAGGFTNYLLTNIESFPNNTLVQFTTTGTLPTGLSTNTIYYVVQSDGISMMKVSTSSGGAEVAISGAGTGVHTIWSCPFYSPATEVSVASDTLSKRTDVMGDAYNWNVYSANIGASSASVYVSSVNYATVSGTQAGPTNIGINAYAGELSDCDVAEIIMYNRALSTAEMAQVENYLRRKYNLL